MESSTGTSFGRILGQPHAVAQLRRAVQEQRIPSAYLFLGPHHVGKRTTALALAQALNCAERSGEGCGVCPSCRKIAEGVHPDVDLVEPQGQNVRIDQIREVGNRLGLIPYEARRRVVIVAQAERMNLPAANAFLKTLEEPPTNTLIVLCAAEAARLPETIVSRCVPVRFGLLPDDTVRRLFTEIATIEEHTPPQRGKPGKHSKRGKAAVEAGLLEGGPLEDGPLEDGPLESSALEFAVRIAQGRLRPGLPGKAQHWLTLREEALQGLQGLRAAIAPPGTDFPRLSETIARWASGEDWRFVLEWLEGWFRDLALLGAGAEGVPLVNADRRSVLEEWRALITPERAAYEHGRVLETRDNIVTMNANKALALEALWLGFKHPQQVRGRYAPLPMTAPAGALTGR